MSAALDEIAREVRREGMRHAQIYERLSRLVGPVDGHEGMSLPELAKYGLKKLGLPVPDDGEHPAVAKLEQALQRRGGSLGGEMGGMDAAGETFVDRYLRS